MDESTTTVRHDPDEARYELLVEGRVVCHAEYHDARGVRTFTHTLTDPAERGKGFAARLVRAALDQTRSSGLAVVPACWFVADFVQLHPEYRDLLA